MDRNRFQLQQSVHETLSECPSAAKAFLALKTQCIGCYLARFCSLQDVANTYHIPAQTLLGELEEAANESQTSLRSK